MKAVKMLLISCLVVLTATIYAQLNVESAGIVKIGSGSLRIDSNSSGWGFVYKGNSHNKGLRFTSSGKMYLYNADPVSFVTATSATSQRNLVVMNPGTL